jgi:ABC-type multidrug transport system ATPase subunit
MMHFLHTYQQNKIEYQHLTCVFDQVSFKKKLPDLEIPNIVTITRINIKNEAVHLKSYTNIDIIQGKKYLFQSPPGSGKTTFINAFLGKIKGIELSKNQPENYNWEIVVYHQDMKTNTANISIKELFELYGNCNFNYTLMKKVCNICLLNNWISSKNIDKEIKNQISGGEKKRLQLALKIYNLVSHNHKILILDEPEAGSDPEIAYKMLQNIQNYFQNKTIIVISHLEKIKEKYKWDYFLGIENNIILFSEKSIAKINIKRYQYILYLLKNIRVFLYFNIIIVCKYIIKRIR